MSGKRERERESSPLQKSDRSSLRIPTRILAFFGIFSPILSKNFSILFTLSNLKYKECSRRERERGRVIYVLKKENGKIIIILKCILLSPLSLSLFVQFHSLTILSNWMPLRRTSHSLSFSHFQNFYISPFVFSLHFLPLFWCKNQNVSWIQELENHSSSPSSLFSLSDILSLSLVISFETAKEGENKSHLFLFHSVTRRKCNKTVNDTERNGETIREREDEMVFRYKMYRNGTQLDINERKSK